MTNSMPESDWQYFRKIKDELFNELCERINDEVRQILESTEQSPHQKFTAIHDYVKESRKVLSDCFDDWRRSNLLIKILTLSQHDLLSDEHIEELSDSTRRTLEKLSDL